MVPGIFRVLRTGLCGLIPEEVDLLENYVLAAGYEKPQPMEEAI